MALNFGSWSKSIARLTAVVVVAAGASACSSVPDWVDPTTWIGDSQSASDSDAQTADNGNDPDTGSSQASPTNRMRHRPSTSASRSPISLAADRANSHYSADALRAGTEPAAAPPPPAGAADPEPMRRTGRIERAATKRARISHRVPTAAIVKFDGAVGEWSGQPGPGAPAADQTAAAPEPLHLRQHGSPNSKLPLRRLGGDAACSIEPSGLHCSSDGRPTTGISAVQGAGTRSLDRAVRGTAHSCPL